MPVRDYSFLSTQRGWKWVLKQVAISFFNQISHLKNIAINTEKSHPVSQDKYISYTRIKTP